MNDPELEKRIRELIDGYVERFAKSNHITVEEARQWANVRIYEEYIRENPPKEGTDDHIPKTELDIGCKGGC